jgi:hypothetical protein
VTTRGGIRLDDGDFLGPNSLVLDGEGNVYIAEVGSDRIQKFRLLPPLAPSGPDSSPGSTKRETTGMMARLGMAVDCGGGGGRSGDDDS